MYTGGFINLLRAFMNNNLACYLRIVVILQQL